MDGKNREICKNPYRRDVACYVSTAELVASLKIGVAQ
jgi:hypothetical protein